VTPTRADLAKQPADVAAMFDDVAPRYDLVNDVLSLGQDRAWRKVVAKAVAARTGERVLDVAAGTGTSSASFTTDGATCVACDFSLGMLRQGARQRGGAGVGGVRFIAGDALALPFADASFDAVTISFGLRNVHDVDAALRELLRVTKPGGRLVICEFSSPVWTPFRRLYDGYLGVMPAIVKKVSSNPDSYVYLAESIRAWPAQSALAGRIAAAGWSGVAWRNLTGGIVAVHRASRPK
jgi:demethylmenaquinone methyltransferase / 2-methoxy-6-polyprenyl-1,4-benzoquinol methylase